jgi:hypothetical protein
MAQYSLVFLISRDVFAVPNRTRLLRRTWCVQTGACSKEACCEAPLEPGIPDSSLVFGLGDQPWHRIPKEGLSKSVSDSAVRPLVS